MGKALGNIELLLKVQLPQDILGAHGLVVLHEHHIQPGLVYRMAGADWKPSGNRFRGGVCHSRQHASDSP